MFVGTNRYRGVVRGIVAIGAVVATIGWLTAAPATAASKQPPSTANISTDIGHAVAAVPAGVSAGQHDSIARAAHLEAAPDTGLVDCSHLDCYRLCWDGHDNNETFCVDSATQNGRFSVTSNFVPWAIIKFINKRVYNGHNWWELEDQITGLCLNWGGPDNNWIFANSCRLEDENELFYNGVEGQLVNLEGNIAWGKSSFLFFRVCQSDNGAQCIMDLDPKPTPVGPTGWTEYLIVP